MGRCFTFTLLCGKASHKRKTSFYGEGGFSLCNAVISNYAANSSLTGYFKRLYRVYLVIILL